MKEKIANWENVPMGVRLLFLGGSIIIAFIWWWYLHHIAKKKAAIEEIEKPKEKFAMDSYKFVFYETDVYESPVDEKLRVRVVRHKNKDIQTFATSRPHVFNEDEILKIIASIPEIVSTEFNSHEIHVRKSAAARWDFVDTLLKKIFFQLHVMYAQRFFRQRFRIKKNGDESIDLIFNENINCIGDFSDLLQECRSIYHVILHDNITEHKVVLIKNVDNNWQELKDDVLAVIADYFPAGVDWEGDWVDNNDDVNTREVKVHVSEDYKFNKFILEFPVGLLNHSPQSIAILLEASDEIENCHFVEVFSPRKTVLEIQPRFGHSAEQLQKDIISAFLVFDSEHDYIFFRENNPW